MQTPILRRDFLRATALAPLALVPSALAFAPRYDLVIWGGRVVDPGQRVDRMADVAIAGGKIAAIKPAISPASARETIDATGKFVTPGLIDIHTHMADPMMTPAMVLKDGVTSLIDAGSRGCDNPDDLLAIAQKAPNRLRIFLNIGHLGVLPEGELLKLEDVKPDATRQVIERNRQWIVGIKARLSRNVAGENDREALRRARQAADPLKVPIMIHMGQSVSSLPDILALLRPGDIVTHLYSPPPHGILDDNGKLLPAVLEARKRGILFDLGNGRNGHLTWEVAESAIRQGFLPDTISTDMTAIGRTYQVFNIQNVMSKMLMLGMTINQVIACVTANAARAIPEFKTYGTLKTGAVADIALMELKDGEFEFVDNVNAKRTGRKKLFTYAAVVGGKRVQV
jgi:dihydroorotase